MAQNKVIVVSKRTAWEQYQIDPETCENISGDSLKRVQDSHARHKESLDNVLRMLSNMKIKPWLVEGAETAFDVGLSDFVITVGGDGTLLSASHHIPSNVIVLGINSDPIFSKGHFCAGPADDSMNEKIDKVLYSLKNPGFASYSQLLTRLARMKITIGDRVVADRILNEALFCHSCPAAMTKCTITNDWAPTPEAWKEYRSSNSGIWIGTASGSTGAIASAGGIKMKLDDWRLQAVIREAWLPKPESGFHSLEVGDAFTIVSKIADATIYLDGPFLRVPVGFDQSVKFNVSDQHLTLVV